MGKRTGSLWALAVAVVAVLTLVGCAGGGGGGGATKSAEPYKIGAIFSTTGPLATLGTDEYNGAKLYVERINRAGGVNGHPLELVFVDAQSKPEVAANAARRLIQEDKVVALIGPESTAVMTALVPIVNEFKVPNVSGQGAINGQDLNSRDYPWSFSVVSTTYLSQMVLFQYMKALGKTRAAVITTADAVGDGALKYAPTTSAKYGVQVVGSERFNANDKDMTVQLTKVRNLNPKPEAILLNTSGAGAAILTRNFKDLGMDKEMLLTSIPSQVVASYVEQTGEAGDGVIACTDKSAVWKELPEGDSFKASIKDFATEAEKAAGKPLEWTIVAGANMLVHVVEALKTTGPDPDKIRGHIENNQTGLQAIGNKFSKSKDDHIGYAQSDYVIVKLDARQKKWVLQDYQVKD